MIRATLLSILLLFFAVTPVFAQQAEDQGQQRRNERQQLREQAKEDAKEKRSEKEARTAEIKTQVAERKAALTQEKCERKQVRLERSLPRLSRNATNIHSVLDKMLDRVTGFYESGQLTVENYEMLLAEVELAKAEASEAVNTIDEFEFELDCEAEDVGEQLDGFRIAVTEAKDSLKNYRAALVTLISSMRAAAAQSNTDNAIDSSEEAENEEDSDQQNEQEASDE